MTLQQMKEKLVINNNESKINTKQLNLSTPSTYLGVTSQLNGLQEEQVQMLTTSA